MSEEPVVGADDDRGGDDAASDSDGTSTGRSSRRPRMATPEQSRDDTDEGWGDWRDREDRDRWILDQRPPHWD